MQRFFNAIKWWKKWVEPLSNIFRIFPTFPVYEISMIYDIMFVFPIYDYSSGDMICFFPGVSLQSERLWHSWLVVASYDYDVFHVLSIPTYIVNT